VNVPSLEIIRDGDRWLAAIVTSGAPDQFPGCYWFLYDETGHQVTYGFSKGFDGGGAGSWPCAERLARRAAKRHFRRLAQEAAT
jgi:hypothetical protein